jgi:fructose-1,6-bisphosphatase
MTNVKVTCACGAIYEVIETKGPFRDPYARKNCSHGREIMSDGYALFGALTRIESKRKTKNSTH